MNIALPSALKLSSETAIYLNPAIVVDKSALNDQEYLIIEALEMQEKLSLLKNTNNFISAKLNKEKV